MNEHLIPILLIENGKLINNQRDRLSELLKDVENQIMDQFIVLEVDNPNDTQTKISFQIAPDPFSIKVTDPDSGQKETLELKQKEMISKSPKTISGTLEQVRKQLKRRNK